MRSCGIVEWLAMATVGCATIAACVDNDFAEGQFLCNPAAPGDDCPGEMFCAADGRCRSTALPGTGGSAGTGTGGTAGTGGTGTGATGTGGTAGAGGTGVGGGGGMGSCEDTYQVRTAQAIRQNDDDTYINPWEQLTEMAALDGTSTHTTSALEDQRASDLLVLTDFGFALPADAEVLGIEFSLWRRKSGTGTIRDDIMRLDTSEGYTTNIPNGGAWPDTMAEDPHGSDNQLWDRSWTAALINEEAFGIRMQVRSVAGNGDVAQPHIDQVELTVHYRPACNGGT